MDCGAPDEPASNGTVSFGPTTFRETANYSCSPGYDLVGPERVVCQADGTWSERPPNCIRKQHSLSVALDTHMHLSMPYTVLANLN